MLQPVASERPVITNRLCTPPSDRRLGMAPRAAIEIEPRTEAVRGSVDFLEDFLRHIEILTLHVVETRQRSSRSGISTPHTRIGRRARGRAAGVVILPAAPRISGHRVRVRD